MSLGPAATGPHPAMGRQAPTDAAATATSTEAKVRAAAERHGVQLDARYFDDFDGPIPVHIAEQMSKMFEIMHGGNNNTAAAPGAPGTAAPGDAATVANKFSQLLKDPAHANLAEAFSAFAEGKPPNARTVMAFLQELIAAVENGDPAAQALWATVEQDAPQVAQALRPAEAETAGV